MQNNSDFARLDQLVFHTQEDAQLQGNIELEKDQSNIARIISISASVVPDDVELTDDTLEFSGKLIFDVLYVSTDGEDDVIALQAQSNFSHSIHAPGVQSGMQEIFTVQVEDVEELLEDPRTISLTADVRFDVWVFETKEVGGELSDPNLQCKKETFAGVETLERQTQEVDVTDQVQLPLRALPVEKILSYDAFALVRDVTGTVEGTHVDGELMVFMTYYGSRDDQLLFQTANFTVPFGFDLSWQQRGMGENAHVVLATESLQLTPSADEMGEMRMIDVQAQVIANASLWQETQVELPTDAYLPGHRTQSTMQSVKLLSPMQEKCTQRMHRFSVSLPSGYPPMEEVLQIRARPIVRSCVCDGDGLLAAGSILCDIVYRTQDDAIYGFHATVPLEERLPLACSGEDVQVRVYCLQSTAGVLDARQAECRLQIETCARCLQCRDAEFVSSVEDLGKAQDESAIVMSIAGKGDDLWSIAKRFNVSMDAVLAANPKYENQTPASGDRILLYRQLTR